MKSLHLPRTLRPTREGWGFLLATFALGLAATNTGNNLLYLIFAMMLSFIIISGLLSDGSLRGLEVERSLPRHIFASEATPTRVTLKNKKRRFSSYSLYLVEANAPGSQEFGAFFLKVGPGEAHARNHTLVFSRRGLERLPGIKILTRYPFGLFAKATRPTSPKEVLVYPQVKPLPPALVRTLSGWGIRERPRKGRGPSLLGLRPYQEGDDLRLVHWKTSAKASQLMLKELEQEEAGRACLILEEPASGGPPTPLWEEDIKLAASIAVHLLRSGAEVSLFSRNGFIPYGRGETQLERLLEHLALYQPGKGQIEKPQVGEKALSLVIRLGEGLIPPETTR